MAGVAKAKKDLPVFVLIDMPKWKAKILDVMTSILFPGEKYFVITLRNSFMTTNGKGRYTDDRGVSVDV